MNGIKKWEVLASVAMCRLGTHIGGLGAISLPQGSL
jgi:hypothetical protein